MTDYGPDPLRSMKPILVGLVIFALMGLAVGCMAKGSRTFTIKAFGNEIQIIDKVDHNSEGEDIYKAGFDEDSSVLKMLLGELKEEPESEDAGEPATGDEG